MSQLTSSGVLECLLSAKLRNVFTVQEQLGQTVGTTGGRWPPYVGPGETSQTHSTQSQAQSGFTAGRRGPDPFPVLLGSVPVLGDGDLWWTEGVADKCLYYYYFFFFN